ncbi:hypothetical protein H5410_010512 [Solanum commersonii]|uniref:Ulp1 protease family, C-terminal catalytic domain containing protein n=1 Tax=Solanum commersonii TaxID=4109 RepID=A0A9J6AKX7_SOLCO|nr:hypothetical protein H5410_010512 [Solanum commersonii]
MDHPFFNIGISQLITPNNEQIFESEHPNLTEQRSKSLHATSLMANRVSTKRKLKTEVGSSSKANDAETKKKRGRKVAPPISRPTLPMVSLLKNKVSCDCGTYVAAFDEFLSHEIKVPSIPFRSEYLRSRYATLLWKYDTDKVNAGYVSENDDPIRLNVVSILLADDELINVE